ncbi:MAG: cbb3-type cytochrome c oxidase subunit 3 [Longimicrobiales bacterium]|nr:cbb3-type cytochrome c oxidase subunit 3 [Longimicrobiales bacterium]
MNPLFNQAEATVEGGVLLGIMTALFLLFFIGWALWAYDPRRKDAMDAAARMPLDEGDQG